ncbi:YdcF family protein [Methylobacter sp. S3L5C]|uniref:YdcF family protein n=1 Tax=Methylobacter sp. S3L5C TaxID=2839024 RepID=UPI001FAD797F|nr:YdcF family protein [Methylobacter sp. S3L5C]UOA08287.1 YdcF family protein [Methylobacter sp. S3L5C]
MKLTLAVTGILLLLVAILFLNLGHWLSTPANTSVKADLIVTLGGGEVERDKMAVELYKAGYAPKILLTGMFPSLRAGQSYYKSPRSLFFLKQGIPPEALLFDGLSVNTHQEALNLATLLTVHHWHSVLVVSDPPHLRRINFCLQPVFKNAGLSYRVIQSTTPTWQADRWWQDKRWRQFCLNEMVKLIFYALVYGV